MSKTFSTRPPGPGATSSGLNPSGRGTTGPWWPCGTTLVQEQKSPQATDKFDRDFIRALLAREPDALGEINAAIERILGGDYGVCEATGRRISPQRLRAAPWTRR